MTLVSLSRQLFLIESKVPYPSFNIFLLFTSSRSPSLFLKFKIGKIIEQKRSLETMATSPIRVADVIARNGTEANFKQEICQGDSQLYLMRHRRGVVIVAS